jgi:hypothetical protein
MEKKEVKEIQKLKVAKVVSLRNRFFFLLYRYSMLVFFISLATTIFSIFFMLSFVSKPIPPQYIPVNADGTFLKLTPLSECKEDADVQSFAYNVVQKLYKYDFVNYADQLQEAAPYFTREGWDEYLSGFGNSGTLAAVKQNKWVVTVNPNDMPTVTKKWVDNGVCMWEVKEKINVSFVGGTSHEVGGDFYVRIIRDTVINHPEGLAITKVLFIENK